MILYEKSERYVLLIRIRAEHTQRRSAALPLVLTKECNPRHDNVVFSCVLSLSPSLSLSLSLSLFLSLREDNSIDYRANRRRP